MFKNFKTNLIPLHEEKHIYKDQQYKITLKIEAKANRIASDGYSFAYCNISVRQN